MAAFIGTVVLLLNGKKKNRTAIFTIVLANYLTAVYLTALVAEFSNLKSLEGIAFAIGVGGFKFIERITNEILNRINKPQDNGKSDDSPE
ncbi:hypothetical protein SAMN05216327_101185 [Dyadobacter sp. SG02]|nr:hypothetical protein SAMN05216327_101185 [Dyadobacter sp. SG02]